MIQCDVCLGKSARTLALKPSSMSEDYFRVIRWIELCHADETPFIEALNGWLSAYIESMQNRPWVRQSSEAIEKTVAGKE